MNGIICELSLLTANATLYKWLLGGGIGLMAILGLVFFGMLALRVLQQEEPAETPATDGDPAPTVYEPAEEDTPSEETDVHDEAEEQEGEQQ